MKVQTGKYADVDEHLRDYKDIVEIYSIQGEYGLIIEIKLNNSTLAHILYELASIEGVIKTDTLSVIEDIKPISKNKQIFWPLRRDTALIVRRKRINNYFSIPHVYLSKLFFLLFLLPSILSYFTYYYQNLLPFTIPYPTLFEFFPPAWAIILCLLMLILRITHRPNIILKAEEEQKQLNFTILYIQGEEYQNICQEVRRLTNLREAYSISGIGNILLKWEYQNEQEMGETIQHLHGNVEGVTELKNYQVICTIKSIIKENETKIIETEDGIWLPLSKDITGIGKLFISYSALALLVLLAISVFLLQKIKADIIVAFIFAIILMIYFHKVRPFKMRTGVAWAITGIILSLTLTFGIKTQRQFGGRKSIKKLGIITGGTVNIRSGPGRGFRVKKQLKRYQIQEILEKQGEWYRININGDGWVHSKLLKPFEYEISTKPLQTR